MPWPMRAISWAGETNAIKYWDLDVWGLEERQTLMERWVRCAAPRAV